MGIAFHCQTGAAALDGPVVEVAEAQAGGPDEALALAAGGEEGHLAPERGALGGDGVDDIDDCAAGSDADVAVAGLQVFGHGAGGGGLFGGLDGGQGGHGAGCC
ncbi:hypothetical protein HYQ46_001556 [Verticillium longisporum]|nr:hypothetical protein HYQ46_001556 [Verticillium longisporum]